MCKIQVRISEGKKERNGMGRSRTFQESERREGSMEGRQEGREGEQYKRVQQKQ